MAKRSLKPAGRAFTDVELPDLVTAWNAGDAEQLDRIGRVAGVKLTIETLQAMQPARLGFAKEDVLATIGQALAEPAGIAVRHGPSAVCLVVIADGKLVVGLASTSKNQLARPWPQLSPWSKDLTRNRKRVEAWLAAPERDDTTDDVSDRYAFELVPIAAPQADPRIPELIAAIVREPHDDTPRLVLADILQQQGDPHGELIALACNFARAAPADPDTRRALEAKIAHLEAVHGQRIAGRVSRCASKLELSRGFVSAVTMTAPDFASHGDELFQAHPIETLRLHPLNPTTITDLSETPALSRVRSLVLDGAGRHHRGDAPIPLRALGASPHLDHLVELRLVGVNAEDWARMFETLRVPALRSLSIEGSLYGKQLDVPALASAIASGRFPSLDRLELLTQFSRREAVSDLLAALGTCPTLRTLRLVRCSFVDARAIARLFEGPGGRAIEQLDVQCDELDDAALEAIARAGDCALRRLCVSHTKVRGNALLALLRSPAGRHIEMLDATDTFFAYSETNAKELFERFADLPDHPLRDVRISDMSLVPERFRQRA